MTLFLLLAQLTTAATPVAAQTPAWEIEGYGGIVAARTASEGSRTLPPVGAPIVTSNPIFPSRQVSSWFFGDGATLLNDVNREFAISGRITPLDAAFSPLTSARVADVGIRLRRRMSPRISAEISVDRFTRPEDRSSDLTAAVEAARSSFKTAFADLLTTGPFAGVIVDATSATASRVTRRETAATVALSARFRPRGSLVPYGTFGGGVMVGNGALPSASLEGRYRFSILGEVPIDETDRVSLRYARRTAFVAVLGGGLRRDMSNAWGIRVDGRMLIGPDTTRVLVDATPSTVRSGLSGFIEAGTNPAVVFSNDPSTGRRPTLSGPALQAFDVFKGGLQSRTLLTVGVFRRF